MGAPRRQYPLLVLMILVVAALGILVACSLPSTESTATEPVASAPVAQAVQPAQPAQPAPAAPKPAPAKAPDDPYAITPEPLTVAQCGQCHPTYFQAIRDEGGKHRFACQDCHQVFHAYNPIRQNWAEIMPNCADCHTLPHGEKHSNCLSCHLDPHKPLHIPYGEGSAVVKACTECHSGPAAELAQWPSKHTKEACTSCHYNQHGYVPTCFECHQPHYPEQTLAGCAECHPVHKPLDMAFTATTGARTCQACHSQAYEDWEKTTSKHGDLNCSVCHTAHAMVPTCASCHGQPHTESLHARFPECLSCHLNPHDLPVKK